MNEQVRIEFYIFSSYRNFYTNSFLIRKLISKIHLGIYPACFSDYELEGFNNQFIVAGYGSTEVVDTTQDSIDKLNKTYLVNEDDSIFILNKESKLTMTTLHQSRCPRTYSGTICTYSTTSSSCKGKVILNNITSSIDEHLFFSVPKVIVDPVCWSVRQINKINLSLLV